MLLIPDAKRVLKRAWSLRLIEAAAVADIALNVVPSMSDLLPWWLTLVILASAWIARLLPQFKKETTDGAS